MEILKNRQGRKYSEYVDTHPELPTYNLDSIAERNKAYGLMPSSFISEDGLTATEVFNKQLDEQVENLIGRYPAHLATGEYLPLTIRDKNLIAWNKEALSIFIHSDYPALFNKFKKSIEYNLLSQWLKIDTSSLDTEQWRDNVDKALTEFAFQYLNNVEN